VSAKFFGQFLLERGAISRDQLLAAVQIQESTNILLGTRAIDAGHMTAAQVEEINLAQRSVDRRFGELAVERGYLTEEQLKGLLTRQREERLMLGEALLKIGALDTSALAASLAAFKASSQGPVAGTIAEIYDGLPGAGLLEVVADVTVKMFLRMLHTAVRPGNCHGELAKIAKADHTIHQRLTGDLNATIALDVSSDLLRAIAGKLLGEEVAKVDGDAIDGAAEFLNIVMGNVCARMSATGRQVEIAPPGVHHGIAGPFRYVSGPKGRVVVTPLQHPDETIALVVGL
jgi:CheY-specific phosphatase CheX